ncbi:MAG: type II toxin-antitoxin system VapC family toxin [Planctomycetota bacterium]|jgi:predicted nucleic acid-binding protein
MNILFDINVILDALLDREPYGKDAAWLINAVEESTINGFLSADSVTTLYYLIQKVKDKKYARKHINLLLELFEIAPINRSILQEAIEIDFSDYEDAVVYQSAFFSNCDGIVTSNVKDYKKSKISIYSPNELLNAVK